MSRHKSSEAIPRIALHPDTVDRMRRIVADAGSYRKAAHSLGISHAVIFNIVNGRAQDVSRDTENRIRSLLGLAPLPPMIAVPACEDCGSVHTGRCHGKQVKVIAVRQREYQTVYSMPTDVLGWKIKRRAEIVEEVEE